MDALGMIEVYGYLAAVVALDSAVKAANVSLVAVTKVTGGLVSVMVSGDVGAIKAAIDAAATAAAQVGDVASAHVIPRPASDIGKMIGMKGIETLPLRRMKIMESNLSESRKCGRDNLTEEEMEKMKVVNLRSLARELQLSNMTKEEIRFAKKNEIISAIMKHSKGE